MTHTKTHDPWLTTHLLDASAMNNLEDQWITIAALADTHTHNDRYYTKTEADATFFSLTFYTGFDADSLDGTEYAGIVSAVLPIGAIMIWSGLDSNVPSGWYICDGNAHNGYTTPNLTERFVIGAGGSYDVGDTGGPATYDGTITPTGSVTVGNHAVTTAELPAHTHTYTDYYSPLNNYHSDSNSGISFTSVASTTSTFANQDTGGGGTHNHTSGSSITFNAIDPRPYYYSLYYIMKCE